MERRVKERLVGAAVLVAAAIILIPEMLSGPKDKMPAQAAASQSGPLKTYTIDLNRSPGMSSSAQLEERAPPPEQLSAPTAESIAAPEAVPENAVVDQPSPEAEPSAPVEQRQIEAPRVAVAPQPSAQPPRAPVQSTPSRETSAPPIASPPSIPTSRGWAVQAGSFASRATADRLAKDLSTFGQSAFVMPVKSGTTTLYRVRIGPFADRAAANDALRGVKGRVANAAVVAHP